MKQHRKPRRTFPNALPLPGWPVSRFGQNFLIDLNLIDLIARSAELRKTDVVLEVGTGVGSLTTRLSDQAGAVLSVEIDANLHQLASEELARSHECAT